MSSFILFQKTERKASNKMIHLTYFVYQGLQSFLSISFTMLKGENKILEFPNGFNIQSQGFCPSSDLLYLSSIGAVFRSFGYGTDSPEWCSGVALTVYPGLAGNEILPLKE